MATIEEKLEDGRNELLDLTFRNRLISYKPAKAKSILVVDEEPREIFDILVLQEKKMQFSPKPDGTATEPAESSPIEDRDDILADDAVMIWTLPEPDARTPGNHTDLFLQTTLEVESLQKRLFYISQESQSVFEEQGYTILYLAAGFLEWSETANSDIRKAPLILIPVEIQRDQVRSAFKLAWTGEDIVTNASFQAKLRELNVELPPLEMPEEKGDIDQYLQMVTASIKGHERWRVTKEIHLDFFTFSKFVMFRDLDPAAWPGDTSPAQHSIIKAIFQNEPLTVSQSGNIHAFSEQEVDTLPVTSVHHVLDADSSQIAVIEDLKAGMSLVVEGPPGTGKSQTIVNVIAEFLSIGKTVLFVSEKMAALDVVKSRLDDLGLGVFCLELHNSKKANKKKVLADIQRTLAYQVPAVKNDDEMLQSIEDLRKILNGYTEAVNTPVGGRDLSPYTLYGIRENAQRVFTEAGRTMPRVALPTVETITPSQWTAAGRTLKELDVLLPLVSPIKENPWRDSTTTSTIVSMDIEEIRKSLETGLETLSEIQMNTARLVEYAGIAEPKTFIELVNAIQATELLVASGPVEQSVLLNESWNGPNNEAEVLVQKIETYQIVRASLASSMQKSVFEADLDSLILEFETSAKKILRSFLGPYNKIRDQIDGYYLTQEKRSDEVLLKGLRDVQQCNIHQGEIEGAETIGRSMFGKYWQGVASNPADLRTFSGWIVSFRREILTEVLTDRSIEIVSRGVEADQIHVYTGAIEQARVKFFDQVLGFFKRLNLDTTSILPNTLGNTQFDEIRSVLETFLDTLDQLVPWTQYLDAQEECKETLVAPLIPLIESGQVQAGELLACLDGNYAEALLRTVFIQNRNLEKFVGRVHEQRIDEFVDLDRRMIRRNRDRIAQKLIQNRPSFSVEASRSSEIGVLQTEFNRKRGHMSIRQLLVKAGHPIQQIKPCFMMSPPSIAQFLDPRSIQFDIVIFDEASQVKPAEAIGALLRGRQVAVIGDSRQLPPTSFFDRIVDVPEIESDDLDALPSDMESILNLCKTRFPSRTLRWHYRSRHDSLIALSNQEFYDNFLYVYPSPMREVEELGLKFVYLPDTVYDRGKSSKNRGEARNVAEAVIDHARRHPEKSLGVGTFNIKQQEAILEELERLRRENPDLESFFAAKGADAFFVKNLETIQGDERDVIFLSVGFGFDPQHKLTLTFGALNKEGGERRLNVLITRARERCVVFANFRAADLPIADIATASRGLQVLKLFLEYAETGVIPCTTGPLADSDSPFEDEVYTFLTENGHQVHKQVGCAGFRIDLAVVNPKHPGEYMIGVECDGATYHSSHTARDRDRLRQQILEKLGWRIARVWSTDWFKHPSACQEALCEAIEQARNGVEAESVRPAEVSLSTPEPELIFDNPGAEEYHELDDVVTELFVPSDHVESEKGTIPTYVLCDTLIVPGGIEPKDYPPLQMAKLIERVVGVEGPVHNDEVVKRIKDAFGVKRAGNQIRAAIDAGVKKAAELGYIECRGPFLWPREPRASVVRLRGEAVKPQSDMICDEELEEAVLIVLKKQFATEQDALAIETCRLVGIRKASADTRKRVEQVISGMMTSGMIAEKANGLIDITSDRGEPGLVPPVG